MSPYRSDHCHAFRWSRKKDNSHNSGNRRTPQDLPIERQHQEVAEISRECPGSGRSCSAQRACRSSTSRPDPCRSIQVRQASAHEVRRPMRSEQAGGLGIDNELPTRLFVLAFRPHQLTAHFDETARDGDHPGVEVDPLQRSAKSSLRRSPYRTASRSSPPHR